METTAKVLETMRSAGKPVSAGEGAACRKISDCLKFEEAVNFGLLFCYPGNSSTTLDVFWKNIT